MTAAAPLLQVDGLSRAFGGLQAVAQLSFAVGSGETIGLIGPNGSGKTTVLNLLSGALRPDAGRIAFAGGDLTGAPAHRASRAGIARTFQLVRPLPGMTVEENVVVGSAFGARRASVGVARKEARALIALVGLADRATWPVERLTYIDQKRVELARALAAEPRLLLLDEWLAGLNPTELAAGIELIRRLKGRGIAIVLVEHIMEAVRSLCDRCLVMNAGQRISEGPPAAVLADPAVVRAYLGEERA
jgi:branched-chain amino acid transport system ATP-binding protein